MVEWRYRHAPWAQIIKRRAGVSAGDAGALVRVEVLSYPATVVNRNPVVRSHALVIRLTVHAVWGLFIYRTRILRAARVSTYNKYKYVYIY